jgi:hypothetical protein
MSLNKFTKQSEELVGVGYTGASYQGLSVSLSSDGNTLAVGGPADKSKTQCPYLPMEIH